MGNGAVLDLPEIPGLDKDLRRTKVDIRKALHLRMRGASYQDIAKVVGCTKANVINHLKPFESFLKLNISPELLDEYRKRKADYLDTVELNLLGDLADPEKRKAASLNNTAFAFTQVHTAGRLTRGESTANVSLQALLSHIDKPDPPKGKATKNKDLQADEPPNAT